MGNLLKDLSRVLLKQFFVLLIIIGIFALGYFFRRDIQISYHNWRMESALKSMSKYGKAASREGFEHFEKYSEKRQKHKDALIELGYLEERIFKTEYLTAFSPEMRNAQKEFHERYPGSSYSMGDRGEHEISVTCRKDFMPTWEELIEKYDVPPDDPNDV